jgi:ketosteroid isomerase-like protein
MHVTLREALLCALALCAVVTSAGAQNPSTQSDEQALIQLERDWNAALHRKDVSFIANVLADEFVVTTSSGERATRAQELALVAEFDQQIDSVKLDEFTVKVYDNTAVVWFTEHLVGRRQGAQVEVTFRYTDVFVRRAGRWQCVASQGTRVAP